MAGRRGIGRAAAGALALLMGAAGCSGSSGANPRRIDVEVDAGGTYRAALGATVELTGTAGAPGQAQTTADLEAIGAALRAYDADHQSYPPAYLTDADGRPTVSWRVLLLPYLGEKALYREFDLTKPWDDPANRPLLTRMPAVYRGRGTAKSTTTSYAGVAGPDQVFRGGSADLGGGVRRSEVIDGESMTSAVGPVGALVAIPWTAPRDVPTVERPRLGSAKGFDGPGSGVTPMLFLDGTVIPLLDDTDDQSVHSWTTIASEACTPPVGYSLRLASSWDLDGDGTFETAGQNATYTTSSPGTRVVSYRVIDIFGGVHVQNATVITR